VSNVNVSSNSKEASTGLSNANEGSKTAASEGTDSKQHAAQSTDDSGANAGSQQSQSSNDQSQSGSAAQSQTIAPILMNMADHSVAAMAQVQAAAGSPATQAIQTSVSGAGSAARTSTPASTASSAAAPAPQAPPVINTARLVQSMGQTEMRVGMRSTEFGNISISTSATRDLISAQISVDHGELAKTIAAGLPEMQSKLGNQAMDVRVAMNGTATGQGSGQASGQGSGQGTGTSSSMSNGSADQSRGGRQQTGNLASGYSINGISERQFSSASAVTSTGDGRSSTRLDIRI
jgi:hypothetical protein